MLSPVTGVYVSEKSLLRLLTIELQFIGYPPRSLVTITTDLQHSFKTYFVLMISSSWRIIFHQSPQSPTPVCGFGRVIGSVLWILKKRNRTVKNGSYQWLVIFLQLFSLFTHHASRFTAGRWDQPSSNTSRPTYQRPHPTTLHHCYTPTCSVNF